MDRSATSQPAICVTALPADANAYGNIFGGSLMSLMDMGTERREAKSEFTFLHPPVRAKSAR